MVEKNVERESGTEKNVGREVIDRESCKENLKRK